MSARNIVKFKLDPKKPQAKTAAQRKRLTAVTALLDDNDIPAQSGARQWTRPGALVPTENKQQVTLRLDADVLGFFKGTGKRYQSRINAALREYINAHRKTS